MPVEHLHPYAVRKSAAGSGAGSGYRKPYCLSQADNAASPSIRSYHTATMPVRFRGSRIRFSDYQRRNLATDADTRWRRRFYFITHFDRYNYALDQKWSGALVRYSDYPSYNLPEFTRPFPHHFRRKNTYLIMCMSSYDGRLHTFYNLDNQFHHSIWPWIAIPLLCPSECYPRSARRFENQ